MNKKGDEVVLETIIFIILNLLFFVVMLVFVYNSGNITFVYEQTYAKQIALFIDNAEPKMSILIDLSEIVEIAEKNKQPLEKIVQLNEDENKVEVKLKKKGGYSYQYYSDYKINMKVDSNFLLINIEDE